MSAPEPAALALHAALLVAALMAGLAIPRLKTVVAAKRNPALVLLAGPPEQHLLDRAVEVVVADPHHRDPTEALEAIDMAFQESLLTLSQKHAVRRSPRMRQPHGEQRSLGLHPAQDHPQIMKIGLTLGRRRMGLRHEPHFQRFARLGQNLRTAFADIVTHRGIRQTGRAMLVDQPRQNPSRRVPLLLRGIQSDRSIASIAALYGASRGATRSGAFRTGGTADSNAWRTVRRCTRCLLANARTDSPSIR